jgi:hypothetical protein
VFVPAVAEFHNTWTNMFYILAALKSLQRNVALGTGPLPIFFSVMLLLTGLTSMLFHASLWWLGQKLDEAFENATLIAVLHMTRPPHGQALTRALAHSLAAAVGIFAIPAVFCEVHLVLVILGVLYLRRSGPRGSDIHMRGKGKGGIMVLHTSPSFQQRATVNDPGCWGLRGQECGRGELPRRGPPARGRHARHHRLRMLGETTKETIQF